MDDFRPWHEVARTNEAAHGCPVNIFDRVEISLRLSSRPGSTDGRLGELELVVGALMAVFRVSGGPRARCACRSGSSAGPLARVGVQR